MITRAAQLRRAAESDDVSTTDRARVLLEMADATDRLDQLFDRLSAAAETCDPGSAA